MLHLCDYPLRTTSVASGQRKAVAAKCFEIVFNVSFSPVAPFLCWNPSTTKTGGES